MTYPALLEILKPCGDVYEIAAPKAATRYIVVNVVGLNTFQADDTTVVLGTRIQLAVRFQNPGDPIFFDVCHALTAAGCTYSADGISYDPDYGLLYSTVDLEVEHG